MQREQRKKCTPTCPFFRCGQKALVKPGFGREKFGKDQFRRGGPRSFSRHQEVKEPWCMWTNDVCIGYKCSYAFCEKRALLPDGTCSLEARTISQKTRSIEEEARAEESVMRQARQKLLRRGYDFIE
ncbi:MAG: hypothetical protein J7L98_00410 [Candidatus Verstraetearchaeota archaeon]|nr:hypothetical protein [Candidatus Verstraetearchaeota archaeon]